MTLMDSKVKTNFSYHVNILLPKGGILLNFMHQDCGTYWMTYYRCDTSIINRLDNVNQIINVFLLLISWQFLFYYFFWSCPSNIPVTLQTSWNKVLYWCKYGSTTMVKVIKQRNVETTLWSERTFIKTMLRLKFMS